MDKKQAAVHESAHALCAWFCGQKLSYLTITGPLQENVPQENRTPYYLITSTNRIENCTFEEMQQRLWVYLAPAAADLVLSGQIADSSLPDVHELMLLLTWKNRKIRDLADSARALLDRHGEDWKKAAKSFVELHAKEICTFIRSEKSQRALRELPGELSKAGLLSGFEFACFLERIWGGTPPSALPAGKHVAAKTGSRGVLEALQAISEYQWMALDILEECWPESEAEKLAIESVRGQILNLAATLGEKSGISENHKRVKEKN